MKRINLAILINKIMGIRFEVEPNGDGEMQEIYDNLTITRGNYVNPNGLYVRVEDVAKYLKVRNEDGR